MRIVEHVRLLAVLQRDLRLEHLLRFVDEQDAERAVVDDALGENRDAAEQLVEIENLGHFARDLGERLERLGVVALLLEHARVAERLRDVDAELRENLLVALAEGADPVAEQVERAQHPVLVPERHHELRVHAGHEPEIPRILVHVVHQDRPLLGDRGADDAFADLEAEVQHHVERIALGVRDLQLLRARRACRRRTP